MAIFRRKKGEEVAEEEFKERQPSRRKVKELRGESKRKRKEPLKAWGRKERFLVLIVLLLTLGTSGVLALSARSWKLPGVPRLKLQVPSFSFLKSETVILEADSAKDRQKEEEVVGKFKDATKNLSGVYGLYVVDLTTGFSFGIFEDEIFEPASLNKLPVIAAMYMEEEKGLRSRGPQGPEGNFDLETKYTLKASDKVGGAGSLYSKPAGYEVSYRNLIRLMGEQSDNTAFKIAKKILGDEKIDEVINEIGMSETSITKEDQVTTPYDIGLFFQKLWEGSIVSEKSRDEILEFLTDTIYESWIPEGIPDSVRVAHKFGREVHVVNDAGIVFSEKPFVLVIMSKGVIEREADEIFPDLARIVFDFETEN